MPNLRRGMMAAAGAAGGATNTPFANAYYGLWGANNEAGWLGQGDAYAGVSSPVQVGDHIWKYMKSGCEQKPYVAGIKTDGTLWMWGEGGQGQLGQGNLTDYSSPVQVGSLTDWLQMGITDGASGEVALAVKTDGTLWTWGEGHEGGLGDGTTTDRSSPAQVGSLTDWGDGEFSIENNKRLNGCYRTCGCVKTDGTLWLWGQNNEGQTGNGTNEPDKQSSPVQLGSATNWLQVDGGREYVIYLNTDGEIWGTGDNRYGMLGDGSSDNRFSPVQAGSATDWVDLAAGFWAAAAINSSGELYTWGLNDAGQLGLGDTTKRCVPVQVGSLTDWKYVSSGREAMNAVKTDGTCWTWGNSDMRPAETNSSSPVQVGSRTDYTWTFKPGGRGGNVGSSATI